jgi:chromosomal replication initiation ATPase DnaA
MVAMDTKVSMKKMLSASDDASIVAARDTVMWLAREASHDLSAIGEAFGLDLAAVESAMSRVDRLIEVDPEFAAYLNTYVFVLTMPAGDDL